MEKRNKILLIALFLIGLVGLVVMITVTSNPLIGTWRNVGSSVEWTFTSDTIYTNYNGNFYYEIDTINERICVQERYSDSDLFKDSLENMERVTVRRYDYSIEGNTLELGKHWTEPEMNLLELSKSQRLIDNLFPHEIYVFRRI